jgi:hypothetical protein
MQQVITTKTSSSVLVLGSSSSEVFDYIFDKSESYYSYWASGWTSRGLRKQDSNIYIEKILSHVTRDTLVILNFGLVDILFSARRKIEYDGFYDFKYYLVEIFEGIIFLCSFLKELGFNRIVAAFPSPVVALGDSYWNRSPVKGRNLPSRLMGRMYYDLYQQVSDRMPAFGCFDSLSYGVKRGYLLRHEFMRAVDDHHPDYIKIQDVVKEELISIDSNLPYRHIPLTKLYKSKSYLIKGLKEKMITRPSTMI